MTTQEKADIVSRLRTPLTDNEERVMQHWDAIRRLLLEEQNRGSLPRDIFESLLSDLDEEREEAATEIASLRRELAEARAKPLAGQWRLNPALSGYETNFNEQTITLRFVSYDEFAYASLAITRLVEAPGTPANAAAIRKLSEPE